MNHHIILYAGAGVKFTRGQTVLVPEEQAERFLDESEAIKAAWQNGLNLDHCQFRPVGEVEQPRNEGTKVS